MHSFNGKSGAQFMLTSLAYQGLESGCARQQVSAGPAQVHTLGARSPWCLQETALLMSAQLAHLVHPGISCNTTGRRQGLLLPQTSPHVPTALVLLHCHQSQCEYNSV